MSSDYDEYEIDVPALSCSHYDGVIKLILPKSDPFSNMSSFEELYLNGLLSKIYER